MGKNKKFEEKEKKLEALLRNHPWIEDPMFEQVSEYGDVSKCILDFYSEDLPKNDEVVTCLQQLTAKQKVYLRGRLSERLSYWREQPYCDKETQLACIAKDAFVRGDFTLALIYRYISEKDVAEALQIN